MKTKTQRLAIILCFAIASTQFISCSKTEITKAAQLSSVQNADGAIPTSLIAWYTFNGDVLDHSMYGNNVTFNSATPAPGIKGQPNTAYYFNGRNGYMAVPNSGSLNPANGITMVALVRPMGFYHGECHANRIFMKGSSDADNGVYFLGYDDALYYKNLGCDSAVMENFENFNCDYGNTQYHSTGTIDSSEYITKGNWYSVAFTVDSNRIGRLYVNGTIKEITFNSKSAFTANNSALYIGRDEDVKFPYWFTGIIDEIRIYNRAYNGTIVSNISKDMMH